MMRIESIGKYFGPLGPLGTGYLVDVGSMCSCEIDQNVFDFLVCAFIDETGELGQFVHWENHVKIPTTVG
jgi:hypothetical protein